MVRRTRKTNISDMLENDNITIEVISKIFDEKVVPSIENEKYRYHLTKLFTFALKYYPELFTNISVNSEENSLEVCKNYLSTWANRYISDRENPSIKKPLKNYSEKDPALVTRVASNTGKDSETLNNYLIGHYIYMSAENMNGAILEEFLADVLEPYGWHWCAGSVYRAIDFCYFPEKKNTDDVILLQVKNKYNTENSSSITIREGTSIKKWNRLNRPKAKTGKYNPIPNWDSLVDIIGGTKELSEKLTEENYLDYIQKNTTKKMDILDDSKV